MALFERPNRPFPGFGRLYEAQRDAERQRAEKESALAKIKKLEQDLAASRQAEIEKIEQQTEPTTAPKRRITFED